MLRLIKEFKGANNFKVSEDHLIITYKDRLELYTQKDFRFVGKLPFDLYPSIVKFNKDFFLVTSRGKFFKVNYKLEQEIPFEIKVHELWQWHYVNNEYMFVKYVDASDQKYVCKYDLRSDTLSWKTPCEGYGMSWHDADHWIVIPRAREFLRSYDTNTGAIKWETRVVSARSWPTVYMDTMVVRATTEDGDLGEVIALDLETGNEKWRKSGYQNIELRGDCFHNLEKDGNYRILDARTGELKSEVDLSEEFKKHSIKCAGRFNITDTHIYFKDSRLKVPGGVIAVLGLQTLKIEETQRISENIFDGDGFPIPMGNRIYMQTCMDGNLLVYEKAYH